MGWDNERFINATLVPTDGSVDIGSAGVPFDDVYADRFHGNGAAITAVDHGNCAGRSDDDHTQYHNNTRGDARYYTQAQVTTISGDIVSYVGSNFIDTSEISTISGDILTTVGSLYYTKTYLDGGQLDNRYYTELEINSISGTINTKLETHKTSTDHDSRYYTESEVTTISGDLVSQMITTFLGLSDTPSSFTGHNNEVVMVSGSQLVFTSVSGGAAVDHSLLSNLDYASAGHTGFLSSAQFTTSSGDILSYVSTNYIDTTEMTTISGDIITYVGANFIDTTEMTTISGDIVGQIPSLSGYATTAQVTTVSGDIIAQIPDVSDFITDAEVATISGDIMTGVSAGYISNAEMTTISGDIIAQMPTVAGVTGWVDDGNNFRIYITNGLITAVSGSVDGGFSV